MTKFAKSALILAPLALLAACSGDEPAPPPPADNGVEMLDVTDEAVNVQEAPLVMNTPVMTNDTVVEEAPKAAPDEQIQADADATGMTSRVDRDAEDAPAATNTTATTSEEK